jgi:hypothetical protein
MRAKQLSVRSAAHSSTLTPLISLAATVYALFITFRSLGTSQPTWCSAVEGVLRAGVATVVLVPISLLLSTVYELVKGPGGNNSGA